jgi:phosphoserine phosphatase
VKVFLVRHCETNNNRDGKVQGRLDIPLNDRGCVQATSLAGRLDNEQISAIYSSPLQRARQTSEAIAGALNLEVEIEPRLTEMDVGEMDGLTGAEMRERYPEVMKAWLAGPDETLALPGGESLLDVQARAWGFIESLRSNEEIDSVICVTHNFVVKALIARAIQLPLANISRFRLALGGISVIEFRNERVQVTKLNETCHLPVT